ncbi:MAG TPA: carbohydrate ABC transporter permease [Acidothermaceae bacterium]
MTTPGVLPPPADTAMPVARQRGGRPRVRRLRQRPRALFIVLLVISIAMMLPLLILLITSVTPGAQLDADKWLPAVFRWSNYRDALSGIPFWHYARDSLFLSVVYAGLTTLSSALVGYGFARLRGPGKNMLFGVLIAMMIVPQIVTLIPTYLLFSRVHLVGTYWPWFIWGSAGAPYAIFLYRQFFSSFPRELEEAAEIDGAGRLRTFLTIFLPLSRPLLVTAFVLAFNATWGDYIAPTLFLNQNNTTLAAGLASGYFSSQNIPEPTVLAAGTFLYIIPVVVLFLLAQRHYVRGFINSGLK